MECLKKSWTKCRKCSALLPKNQVVKSHLPTCACSKAVLRLPSLKDFPMALQGLLMKRLYSALKHCPVPCPKSKETLRKVAKGECACRLCYLSSQKLLSSCVFLFVAEMNTLTNAGSDSQLDVVKTENMIKSVKSMFHGVDKAVLEEFVEAGAAMFATGIQMRVANYCVSDLNRLATKHLQKDKSRATAAFRADKGRKVLSKELCQ